MRPKGKIIVIGGNIEMDIKKIAERENGSTERVILPKMIEYAGGPNSRIELLTCATSIPNEVWKDYSDIFKQLGVDNLGNLFIQNHEVANKTETLERIEKADMLLFSGGKQENIRESLKGTKAHELMLTRFLHDDIVIAGTSAGAVALSQKIILGEKVESIYQKDDLIMDKGLGFVNQVIIDTHFTQRARLERLAEAISLYPDKLGIGVGEDTALVINGGNDCEVIGSGKVILIDGTQIGEKISGQNGEPGEPKDDGYIPLFNLVVHILFPQDRYYIQERKLKSNHAKRNYQF